MAAWSAQYLLHWPLILAPVGRRCELGPSLRRLQLLAPSSSPIRPQQQPALAIRPPVAARARHGPAPVAARAWYRPEFAPADRRSRRGTTELAVAGQIPCFLLLRATPAKSSRRDAPRWLLLDGRGDRASSSTTASSSPPPDAP
jgi:hypothetical protein